MKTTEEYTKIATRLISVLITFFEYLEYLLEFRPKLETWFGAYVLVFVDYVVSAVSLIVLYLLLMVWLAKARCGWHHFLNQIRKKPRQGKRL